ncbi:glycosyltransferase [Candidatus Peregrinibacteria bacterium]|nr:glycosyltransferase [Candidatus Peregrinibacteria bacterium]
MQSTLITIGFHSHESPRYVNVCKTYANEGFTIVDCHTIAKGLFAKYRELIQKIRTLPPTPYPLHPVVLVTFPGFIIMPLAWALTRFPRRKLIFDAFVSMSDTLVSDRRKFSWINPVSWLLYLADIVLCHMADEILIDTEAHKQFFVRRFFLNPKRIRVLYVGTREDLFTPGPRESLLQKGKFNVLFIGSFIPLQGVEHIVHAAEVLEKTHPDIHFTLIGGGQTKPMIETLIEQKKLGNVTLLPFQPLTELPKYLRSADIALGTFGTSGKARRVIAHKVFDAVACGIPVITAKNDAITERCTDGREVFLCREGDGSDLARKIVEVKAR